MLFIGLVLPGTNARSGMKAPKGTPMNRLLSTSHTEYCGVCAGAGAGAVQEPTAIATASTPATEADQSHLFIIDPRQSF
jgi:hypothetical protein